jgi:hypothetical protein
MLFDQQIQTLPREELEKLQLCKLRVMLDEIYDRNPLYTRKLKAAGYRPGDLKSLEDIRHLPFTVKPEFIQAQEEDGFSCNLTYPLAAYTRLHLTSGTTGKPLRVFDTADSWDWWARWGPCFRRRRRDGAGPDFLHLQLRTFHRFLGGRGRRQESRRAAGAGRRPQFAGTVAADEGDRLHSFVFYAELRPAPDRGRPGT